MPIFAVAPTDEEKPPPNTKLPVLCSLTLIFKSTVSCCSKLSTTSISANEK